MKISPAFLSLISTIVQNEVYKPRSEKDYLVFQHFAL